MTQPTIPPVTDEEILAGCRAIYPGLFRDGLKPRDDFGPATRAHMETRARDTKAILEAAAQVRAQHGR